jgi:hypothetical protein
MNVPESMYQCREKLLVWNLFHYLAFSQKQGVAQSQEYGMFTVGCTI